MKSNTASNQFQLDIFGEVIDSMSNAHREGIELSDPDWRMQVSLLNFLETKWAHPDEGIREARRAGQNPEAVSEFATSRWSSGDDECLAAFASVFF